MTQTVEELQAMLTSLNNTLYLQSARIRRDGKTTQALKDEKKALEKQVTTLTDFLQGNVEEKAILEGQVTTLTGFLQGNVTALNEEKAILEGQVTTLTGFLQGNVTALNEEKAILEGQVTTLTADKKGLEAEVQELSSSNRVLAATNTHQMFIHQSCQDFYKAQYCSHDLSKFAQEEVDGCSAHYPTDYFTVC